MKKSNEKMLGHLEGYDDIVFNCHESIGVSNATNFLELMGLEKESKQIKDALYHPLIRDDALLQKWLKDFPDIVTQENAEQFLVDPKFVPENFNPHDYKKQPTELKFRLSVGHQSVSWFLHQKIKRDVYL